MPRYDSGARGALAVVGVAWADGSWIIGAGGGAN